MPRPHRRLWRDGVRSGALRRARYRETNSARRTRAAAELGRRGEGQDDPVAQSCVIAPHHPVARQWARVGGSLAGKENLDWLSTTSCG